MGDLQTLAFPMVAGADCQIGGIDPATGDTIAGCLGTAPLPPVSQSVTVSAKAYPTWLYVGAAVLGSVFLLKLVKS